MSRHLTPNQAAAVRDRIRQMRNFIHRCRRRLEALGLDQDNALYRTLEKAYFAMHGLHVVSDNSLPTTPETRQYRSSIEGGKSHDLTR